MVNFSSENIRHSAFRLSTKNAWAKYVRHRFPTNALCEIQRTWKLTEGQARGVLYAQASQTTIDAILDSMSPLKAFSLGLEILCIRLNTSLEDYIRFQAEEACNERAQWEARERHLQALATRVAEHRSFGGPLAEQAGACGPDPQGLGAEGNGADRGLRGRR